MSFIVPPSSGISNLNRGITPGISGASFASSAGNYLINRYGPSLINAGQQRLDRMATNLFDSISGNLNPDNSRLSSDRLSNKKSRPKSSNPVGVSGGSGNGSGLNNPGPSGGRRSRNFPKPGGSAGSLGIPQFTINSGIDSGTIVNPLQKTTDYYTPLFIQCGQLFPSKDKNKDSDFTSLLNSQLYYQYLVIVQSQVNFSLARQFKEDSFYEYIRVISYALQLYYMIDSVLAFTTHTPNYNMAMTTLRMQIDSDISNGHIKLREILESTPIPPRLLEYIRYMYQNYSFTSVTGSSIIRLSLDDSLCTSEYKNHLGITSEIYSYIINQIIECSHVSSILSTIRKNWVTKMPPSSYEALYDPQFSTFWHNSNIAYEDYGSNAVKYTINAKNISDLLYYGIFDNRLDGLIYASCSINDNNNVMQKGLWCPFNDFSSKDSINSSLLHYSNDGLLRPVTDVSFRNASMVFSAPYTEITKDNNPVWVINNSNFAGSCIPQLHSLENVTQAITRSVSWLLAP